MYFHDFSCRMAERMQPTASRLGSPSQSSASKAPMIHSETAPDLKKTAKKTKTPIYAVSLGDIVYSEGPRNANYLMPMIKEEMRAENIGMPMFQTIGNHDCDYEPVAIGARNSTPTVRLQRMFDR